MSTTTSVTQANLTNKQKAALLVLALDLPTATALMRTLSQQEIEDLTVEITRLKGVPAAVTEKVVEEFQQLIAAQEYLIEGGTEQAQALLEKSLGPEKAALILERVRGVTNVRGFNNLKKVDAYQIASFVQKEHPQTIALILSNLRTEQVAEVLSQFPPALRNDVVYRMATLGKVSPSLLAEMEEALETVAQSEMALGVSEAGGPKAVATILNRIGGDTAKEIMEHFEKREPQLAQEIKNLMFMFEDIIYVDDRGIQRVLREVDKKDLALSLKVVDEKLKSKILSNMSERARELLLEELEYMGPVRLKEVEAAQARIVAIVKQLEEAGEIIIVGRGGAEELVV